MEYIKSRRITGIILTILLCHTIILLSLASLTESLEAEFGLFAATENETEETTFDFNSSIAFSHTSGTVGTTSEGETGSAYVDTTFTNSEAFTSSEPDLVSAITTDNNSVITVDITIIETEVSSTVSVDPTTAFTEAISITDLVVIFENSSLPVKSLTNPASKCTFIDTDIDEIEQWLKGIWITRAFVPAKKVELTHNSTCNVTYDVLHTLADIGDYGYTAYKKSIETSISDTAQTNPNVDGYNVDINATFEANNFEQIEKEISKEICDSLNCTEDSQWCDLDYSAAECYDLLEICKETMICNGEDGGFFQTDTELNCRYNKEENSTYCDCGKSLLLENIYVDEQCINTSLLVGLCAGGVGLVLLILFITICCLASSRNKLEKENEQLKESVNDDLEYAFDKPQGFTAADASKSWSSKANEPAWTRYSETKEMSGEEVGLTSFTDEQEKKRQDESKTDYRANDITGYENKAYDIDSSSLKDVAIEDVTKTDAYRNFQPDLANIDTKTHYHIKRPHITLRPQDYYTNAREEEQGFRI